MEKATGAKGYDGIANLSFNGTHNEMAKDRSKRNANGMKDVPLSVLDNNGVPTKGSHSVHSGLNGTNGHSYSAATH